MINTQRNRILSLAVAFGPLLCSFTTANADTRCPNYCTGSTLLQGRWYHGHGDPGCFYSEVPNSHQCGASEINSADVIAGYKYASSDGLLVLDFSSGDQKFVKVTYGESSETLEYAVSGREVIFIGSALPIMKAVWLVEGKGKVIAKADARVSVNRNDW